MSIEYEENENMEASQRPPKRKRLSEILASMSADEADAYLSNIPVHATTDLDEQCRERFSQVEEDNALRAAADARFRSNAIADSAALAHWKY